MPRKGIYKHVLEALLLKTMAGRDILSLPETEGKKGRGSVVQRSATYQVQKTITANEIQSVQKHLVNTTKSSRCLHCEAVEDAACRMVDFCHFPTTII